MEAPRLVYGLVYLRLVLEGSRQIRSCRHPAPSKVPTSKLRLPKNRVPMQEVSPPPKKPSSNLAKLEQFLFANAHYDNAAFDLVYREILNEQCYQKLICHATGMCETTTAPIWLLMQNWRLWELTNAYGRVVYIVYGTANNEPTNMFWETHVRIGEERIPQVRGTFCVMRWYRALPWDEQRAANELRNFMYCKYVTQMPYQFSLDP